jgi:hypothetical protein
MRMRTRITDSISRDDSKAQQQDGGPDSVGHGSLGGWAGAPTWTSLPLFLGRDCGHPEPNEASPQAGQPSGALR